MPCSPRSSMSLQPSPPPLAFRGAYRVQSPPRLVRCKRARIQQQCPHRPPSTVHRVVVVSLLPLLLQRAPAMCGNGLLPFWRWGLEATSHNGRRYLTTVLGLCDCPRQRTTAAGLLQHGVPWCRPGRRPIPVPSYYHHYHPSRAPRTSSGGRPGNYQVTLAGFDIVARPMTNWPACLPMQTPAASNMFTRLLVSTENMLSAFPCLGLTSCPAAGAPP